MTASQLTWSTQSDPDITKLRNYEKRAIVTLFKHLDPQSQQNTTEQTLAISLYVHYNQVGFISTTIQILFNWIYFLITFS